LGHIAAVRVASLRGSRKVVFFIAKLNRPDMHVLRELIESGHVKPVIERRFELEEIAQALRLMGEGHVQGKLVVAISGSVQPGCRATWLQRFATGTRRR